MLWQIHFGTGILINKKATYIRINTTGCQHSAVNKFYLDPMHLCKISAPVCNNQVSIELHFALKTIENSDLAL